MDPSIPTPCCKSRSFRFADDAIRLITASVAREEVFVFLLGELRTFADVYTEGWSLLDPELAKYCLIGMHASQSFYLPLISFGSVVPGLASYKG